MTALPPEEVVTITSLAAGGDGVGRLRDGRAVFVPRTAPGDVIRLSGVRSYRRFARGTIAAIVEPGPDRVAPRCAHYEADCCGGCQLQHLGLERQREARRTFVADALRRIGKFDVADPSLTPSPQAWAYRNRVSLTVADAGRRVGFHRADRPERVFDLVRCELVDPRLQALWEVIRRPDARRMLPPSLDRLTLRLDRAGGRHLLLAVSDTRVWAGGPALGTHLGTEGQETTVWWQPPEGAARVVYGAEGTFPATVFEQVHPAMGDQVRAYAIARLAPGPAMHCWDLYAGIGEATAMIRARGATVDSVELDRRAVAEARGDSLRPEDGVRRLAGRAEDLIGRLSPPAVILANPPRTGMAAEVVRGIAGSGARRLVYVSCDPATLARDLARLRDGPADVGNGGGWRLEDVQAFDLFPQTAHVETVATMERA